MPTLLRILKSPDENAPTRGTINEERDTHSKATVGKHHDNSRNVYGPTKDPFDTAKFGVGKMEPNKKKRKGSILEQLSYDADDDAEESFIADLGGNNDEVSVGAMEKENSIKAASDANNNSKGGNKKSSKKKKTIVDFYSSLSPKQDTSALSEDESTAKVVEKKRPCKAAKFVALNEDAKPIHVHIPFAGQDKNSAVTIAAHCVESKYCLDEPLLLEGEYHRGSETSIARFLSGFGRYCI